jgi:hypothetical protein
MAQMLPLTGMTTKPVVSGRRRKEFGAAAEDDLLFWRQYAGAPINVISTRNDQDAIAWRQWHHWNVLRDAAEGDLPKGISVLTVHVLTQGNVSLAFSDFRYK